MIRKHKNNTYSVLELDTQTAIEYILTEGFATLYDAIESIVSAHKERTNYVSYKEGIQIH